MIAYTSLIYHSNSITVNISSLDDYLNFENIHNSTSINCPCTNLSVMHSEFYEIEPLFHEICSSDFIDDQWLYLLFYTYKDLEKLPTNAFTYIGTALTHFQAMSIMCNLVKQYVIDTRNSFLATSDVSSQMKDSHLFDLDTNSALTDFYSTISNNFVYTLEMFNGFTQASGLISVYSTNWNPYFLDLTEDNSIYFQSQSYG
jgi:hypothetical protein